MDARERTKPPRVPPLVTPEMTREMAYTLYDYLLKKDSLESTIPAMKHELRGQVIDPLGIMKMKDFDYLFELDEGRKRAGLRCPLDVCTQHWTSNGCQLNARCTELHICKYFIITGRCKSSNCKFGHELYSAHNTPLLVKCNLDKLSPDNLKKLIKKAGAFKEKGSPPVCRFYNTESGCTKGDNCVFMHMCDAFLSSDGCLDRACQKNHDLMRPQVVRILSKYGYEATPDNNWRIIQELQSKYHRPVSKGQLTAQKNGMLSQEVPTRPQRQHQSREFNQDSRKDLGSVMQHMTIDGDAKQPASTGAKPKIKTTKQSKSLENNSGEAICTFALTNKCKYKPCRSIHSDLPYAWQYKDKDWMPFTSAVNDQLEDAFCDPKNSVKGVDTGETRMVVNFINMTYDGHESRRGQIRRLSTASWGTANKSRPFITKWLWFFYDDNCEWQTYDNPLEIEEKFVEKEETHEFELRGHEYVLKFREMVQENTEYGTRRNVRRRPHRFDPASIKQAQKKPAKEKRDPTFPSTWHMSNSVEDNEPKLIDLSPEGDEFKMVAARFADTMSEHPVKRIQRIQNIQLWKGYNLKRETMMLKKAVASRPLRSNDTTFCEELNEKLLFHGTKEQFIEPIFKGIGFDFRNAGNSVGTKYGKGNYFALNSSYAKCYTEGFRQLFVVRVLVGDVTNGQPTFTKPPPRDATNPYGDLYDCCVDDETNPTIFVTFEFYQSYPAYLIDY